MDWKVGGRVWREKSAREAGEREKVGMDMRKGMEEGGERGREGKEGWERRDEMDGNEGRGRKEGRE